MRRDFGFAVACFAASLCGAACSSGASSPESLRPSSGNGSGEGSFGSGTGSSHGGSSLGSGSGGSASSGTGGGSGSGSATGSSSGTGSDAGSGSGAGPDSGSGGNTDSGSGGDAGGGGPGTDSGVDADNSDTAVGSASVEWGPPCLYNFGSSCPFPPGQECGNHQGIVVTFPNGPQLLNATLFSGLDCSPTAFTDNFNDRQNTMGSGIWMFTDDAEVAGVSASNPTSVIWWVGPLTASGLPPAGAPTTGCINYTSAMAMCQ
jgi:hypothetical protein